MENKNININELNSTEIMKVIYNETMKLNNTVNEIQKDIKEMKVTLDEHTKKLEEHDKRFDRLEKKTDVMDQKIDKLEKKTDVMDQKIDKLEKKTDVIDKKVDNLDKIERLHFEYTRNKFNRLDKKIESNYSYLDNKIENETEERKMDVKRIEGNDDFEKIVLSDFGSRLTILEEEGEKYSNN